MHSSSLGDYNTFVSLIARRWRSSLEYEAITLLLKSNRDFTVASLISQISYEVFYALSDQPIYKIGQLAWLVETDAPQLMLLLILYFLHQG